ncbi:NfeD family protein [Sandaracinobacteroides hominis]|uniref:NfeD family protein n=1 Tax=Sandaracinobacteroides hominis TaxID=2780086 RepID=UPI0018F638C0|nr:NfeD family protein [Sandaracinobacteroides hominis]
MTDAILGFLFSPWGWLSAAAVLAGLEMLLPGAYMIWLAAAAAATGLTVSVLNVTMEGQLAAFAGWIAISLLASRQLKRLRPIGSDDPGLNRLSLRLLGKGAVVTQAISGGRGKVRLGDSEWIAEGPDAPVGTAVRVTGSEGPILKVASGAEQHDPAG